ncbi:MAG: amidohydrolase family protein [Proteobacteria bacterium]|nr:amidohydrolase family protein [Pseudomonadota bacterium]
MPSKSDNHDWLAQYDEETLEPNLEICDPHHHLWNLRHGRSTTRYQLDELLEDLNSGHNIVSTVFIQCGAEYRPDGPVEMRPVGETEFIADIATKSASGRYGPQRVAAGIIGWANLLLGDVVGAVLDAHIAAGEGRFRGIRCGATYDESDEISNSSWGPPPAILLDPKYRNGVAQLAKRDLVVESWCYHPQLPEMIDLVRACPDARFILDHCGGPLGIGPYEGRRAEIFDLWKGYIAELARCENVIAKLGGLNMVFNGFNWQHRPMPPTSVELLEATRPYFEHLIEQFGVDRCMFESNFPVDKLSCRYNVLWNSFKRLTANYSADEKAKLYHDNAVRIYRLEA